MASLERWQPVEGYEGIYEVSDLGRVRSFRNNRYGLRKEPKIIRGQKGRHYITVALCKDGFVKTAYIHRLVAEAFNCNPECLPVVNHKDGNKLNNRADNLEWCTHEENMHHASTNDIGGFGRRKVVCVENGAVYKSITDAAQKTGVSRRAISNCLCGRCKTAGKKHWGYAN